MSKSGPDFEVRLLAMYGGGSIVELSQLLVCRCSRVILNIEISRSQKMRLDPGGTSSSWDPPNQYSINFQASRGKLRKPTPQNLRKPHCAALEGKFETGGRKMLQWILTQWIPSTPRAPSEYRPTMDIIVAIASPLNFFKNTWQRCTASTTIRTAQQHYSWSSNTHTTCV